MTLARALRAAHFAIHFTAQFNILFPYEQHIFHYTNNHLGTYHVKHEN